MTHKHQHTNEVATMPLLHNSIDVQKPTKPAVIANTGIKQVVVSCAGEKPSEDKDKWDHVICDQGKWG
jgi:hypothetical protein